MTVQPASAWPTTSITISVGVFSAREQPARSAEIVHLRTPRRATLSEPEVTWADLVRDRLNHICALPVGWDGYAGRPTRFDVAEFAVQLLFRVCKPHTPAPAIVPLPSGGLQIEWHTPDVAIELIVRAPYRVEAWVADPRAHDDGLEQLLTNDFTVIVPSVHMVGAPIADHAAA